MVGAAWHDRTQSAQRGGRDGKSVLSTRGLKAKPEMLVQFNQCGARFLTSSLHRQLDRRFFHQDIGQLPAFLISQGDKGRIFDSHEHSPLSYAANASMLADLFYVAIPLLAALNN